MPTSPQTAPQTRRRLNPVAQYLLALAVTVMAYFVYLVFAVPILEGPPNQRPKRIASASIDVQPRYRDKTWLNPFVPADGWELESCKTVVVDEGTILFRDYQPLEDGYAEVFPFTLIMNAKPPRSDGTPSTSVNSDESPVSVRCLQRIRLKLDRPLAESMNGGGLKLENARLVGQVTIYRPPSAAGKQDSLSVVTSNIQIEPTRIFTLEDVRFAFGRHRGQGRHLTIDLERSTEPAANPLANDGFAAIAGVSRIELARNTKLRLEPDGATAFETQSPANATGDELFSSQTSPVEVSCHGPFVFDLETQTASFQERVTVEQFDENRDKLNCERLELAFADSNSVSASQAKAGMNLQSFQAWGAPAEVQAGSRKSRITGDWLSYNASTRVFQATSQQQVTVKTDDFQVVAKELNYVWPEDQSIGPLDATGAGHMLRSASNGQQPLWVEWQRRLQVRPDGHQQHVILDGQTKVLVGTDTTLVADKLDLWLLRSAQSPPNENSPGTIDGPQDRDDWTPSRIVALGNVQLQSPELTGATDQLTATWQRPDAELHAGGTGFPNLRQAHRVAKVAQEGWSTVPPVARVAQQQTDPSREWQTTPFSNIPVRQAMDAQRPGQPPHASHKPTKRLVNFRGNAVNVSLANLDKQTEIVDLKVDGNVLVQQSSTTSNGASTNTISGQHLRLVPQANDQHRVQVSGTADQLAQFRSEQLNLDGQEIFFDQAGNRIWVDGAGKVWLNPESAKRATANASQDNASQLGTTKNLEVSWMAGMIFDGQKIYFEQDVAMAAESFPDENQHVTRSRSFSQGLSIRLLEPIKLAATNQTDTNQKRPKIQIDDVVLVDHLSVDKQVFHHPGSPEATPGFQLAGTSKQLNGGLQTPIVVENTTVDITGRPIERQTVIGPQATYSATSGTVRAKGPGSIQLHRRGKSKAFEGDRVAASDVRSDSQSITLTHVKFDDSVSADANTKEILIRGRVRSLTSPVKSFDAVFDPDLESTTWPLDAVKLVCEQVQLAQWSPQNASKPSNEMIATGNAHITSSRFEATADRVSYSQMNDMLVVEGTPRSDANLWFRQTASSQPSHLVAAKILYRLSDQWTEVQNVRNVKIKSK